VPVDRKLIMASTVTSSSASYDESNAHRDDDRSEENRPRGHFLLLPEPRTEPPEEFLILPRGASRP
jgi:hypothetical protein